MNKRPAFPFPLTLFLVAIWLFAGCNLAKDEHPQIMLKSLQGKAAPVSGVEPVVEQIMERAGVAGLSCAIINGSEIVYVKAFGYKNKKKETRNDIQTIFSAASFSKTVFAYLVMKLVEEGIIDLDKPLQEYLGQPLYRYPEYVDLEGDERCKKLTARIALSHQTGFPNWRFLTEDGKLRFLFDPGARYSYSGEGIALLQMAVEKITGKGLEDLAREKIFAPLGMTRTSYIWREEFTNNYAWPHDEFERPRRKDLRDKAEAAGSMQTTAEDYARLLKDILEAKNLSRALIDEMLTSQVAVTSERMFGPGIWRESNDNQDIHLSWSLGWGRFDSGYGRAFFHTGNEPGFQNYTVTYADAGVGIVLLSNSDNFESVAREILSAFIGPDKSPFDWLGYEPFDPSKKKMPPPERKATAVSPAMLAGYVGEYEIRPGQLIGIKLEGGQLYVDVASGGKRWLELLAESETVFFIEDSDYVFTFGRDPGGRTTSLVLSFKGMEIEGKKLK